MNKYLVMLEDDRFVDYLERFGEILSSHDGFCTINTDKSIEEIGNLPCVKMVGISKGINEILRDLRFVSKELNIEL